MIDNNRVLTVTDVQNVSDTGVYQCMSENSEGVLLKEAILKVNGKVSQWLLGGKFLIIDFHAVESSEEQFIVRCLVIFNVQHCIVIFYRVI